MCLDVGWAAREVSPEESKGVVGLLRDYIDMGIPGQVPCYCNSKVLSCLHKSQVATMDSIGGCNRVPFPSYSDDLTFALVE